MGRTWAGAGKQQRGARRGKEKQREIKQEQRQQVRSRKRYGEEGGGKEKRGACEEQKGAGKSKGSK